MKTNFNLIAIVLVINLGFVIPCQSQPYIDLLNIQYINSPDYGIKNEKKNAIDLKQFSIASTLPFQFKNKLDALIISPGFDMWSTEINTIDKSNNPLYSISLPVSFLKTLNNPDWSILSMMIIRKNGYKISMNDNWQIGGAFLVNFKANENLRYKLGVYANKEFFGLFVVPLLGVDWEISKKTNLFGVLPGNLTLEHRVAKKIYTGAFFRAITTSFRLDTGYLRIDENRLGAFIDFYLAKKIVFNVEAGHSLFRKIRTGVKDKYSTNLNVDDNTYLKIGLAYRLRFQ